MPVSTNKLLEKLLDYTTVKQQVISKNIANISSKNYKREDVNFENIFKMEQTSQLKTTNAKHYTDRTSTNRKSGFEIIQDKSSENVSGYNNVDIDQEMADMAQNSLLFKFAARKLNYYYKSIQNVIRGGGG